MKPLDAQRIQVILGELWQSPELHVLLTEEENVVVARCLDLTVSSHGDNKPDAIQSLGEAIKEYLLTAIEENAMEVVSDPAQDQYWSLFYEMEIKNSLSSLKKSINKSFNESDFKEAKNVKPEIVYA